MQLSPSCSLILTRSEPPTIPIGTFLRSSDINALISPVTTLRGFVSVPSTSNSAIVAIDVDTTVPVVPEAEGLCPSASVPLPEEVLLSNNLYKALQTCKARKSSNYYSKQRDSVPLWRKRARTMAIVGWALCSFCSLPVRHLVRNFSGRIMRTVATMQCADMWCGR